MGTVKAARGAGYGNRYIDSLVWGGSAWNPDGGPIAFYFGDPVDIYLASAVHRGPLQLSAWDELDGWNADEKRAVLTATELFSSVCKLTFVEVDGPLAADLVWWQARADGYLGLHEPPASGQRWGIFNHTATPSWGSFKTGGAGFNTIVHELGHGLGLAHPHDGGSRSDATTFPGVVKNDDLGDNDMNQAIWTVMSYNDGYDPLPVTAAYGHQGGLGAFDIAALQKLYGANTETRTGDDVYHLPSANARGTGWSCIWDAGGTDTISAAGSRKGAEIDLRAATLRNGEGAAGYVSAVNKVSGGVTIAKGVVIENAIGSAAADRITGNARANVLDGRGGADRMDGLAGNDVYYVDNANERVNDTGGGKDTVLTSRSYTLGASASIEILQARDAEAQTSLNLSGNGFSNALGGNAGRNLLDGKGGHDRLTGGLGRDAFLFSTKLDGRSNVDRILDFSPVDDTIRLESAVFHTLRKTGALSAGAFHIATGRALAHDASDRVIYNQDTGFLYYDPDGSGRAGATKFAHVGSGLALTASDFHVV